MEQHSTTENVIIMGAAGRDFHDFMTYWSLQPNTIVKCFTETQIPGIEYRTFPSEMCNNSKNGNLYPEGIKIYPESMLEKLIDHHHITTCTLAYSDLSYDKVQSLASRVSAAGAKFVQLPPKLTQLKSTKPVVAICATRTGTGKSQTTRFVAEYLKNRRKKVAVVRHPMPYDRVLLHQRCQRYETLDDLVRYNCTVEEREEYELHIEAGNLLFAGVDYEMILQQAEDEADIIIWDGGNNDFPFFKPDLQIVVADALRASHESHYFPGEVNVRCADIVLINKVNSLPDISLAYDQARLLRPLIREGVPVLFGNSIVSPEANGKMLSDKEAGMLVKGKRVLVIDDGPTLTHGGMPFGAGYVLAKQLEAGELVNPRKHAKGSYIGIFQQNPHLENVMPAMGYGKHQIEDLEATVHDASGEAECIIAGTPIDLTKIMKIEKPYLRARYRLELVPEYDSKSFTDSLDNFAK
jgi:predicted GTPase